MKGTNKALLIGNLVDDPQYKELPSGKTVANLRVAIDEEWGDDPSKRRTSYHNVVVWGEDAKRCFDNLKRGSGVQVTGRIANRSYDGKDGTKKYVTEIVADNIKPLSGGVDEIPF